MVILEKFRESRDREFGFEFGDEFGSLFIDLIKAFNFIDHNLLMTKLSQCGATTKSLNLNFYQTNRTQIIRISNSYSTTDEIKYFVPQGIVFGPLLFNIALIDLYLECEDHNFNSYPDDTSSYSYTEE